MVLVVLGCWLVLLVVVIRVAALRTDGERERGRGGRVNGERDRGRGRWGRVIGERDGGRGR